MAALQELSGEELIGLDALGARNLVIRCFFSAQKETLARAAQSMKSAPNEEAIHKMVEGAVRMAFRAANGDFENPTQESLTAVVENLAAQAASMGTPPDIIEHHRRQLARIFAALRAAA
jgi:hypothetical protein